MNDLKFFVPNKNESIDFKLIDSFDVNSMYWHLIAPLDYKEFKLELSLGKE